jgi:hypothetical protein
VNISWVLADKTKLNTNTDLDRLRNIGSLWGSWRTWKKYSTDNVVCHDRTKAQDLIKRAFQATCNFYIPNSSYLHFGRPQAVKVYEGDFMGHDADNQDEIVAMNLAGGTSDVVLLLGFDWTVKEPKEDQLEEVRARNYRGLIEQAIKSRPSVQWVLVDHPKDLRPELIKLDNLTKDTLESVLNLLNA